MLLGSERVLLAFLTSQLHLVKFRIQYNSIISNMEYACIYMHYYIYHLTTYSQLSFSSHPAPHAAAPKGRALDIKSDMFKWCFRGWFSWSAVLILWLFCSAGPEPHPQSMCARVSFCFDFCIFGGGDWQYMPMLNGDGCFRNLGCSG